MGAFLNVNVMLKTIFRLAFFLAVALIALVKLHSQSAFYGVACPLPGITAQPNSATEITNATTNFTVTAALAVTYQWQTNNGSGVYVNVSNTVGHFGGTQTATFWITNSPITDSNLMTQVWIANGCGSVTSSVATLTVTNGVAAFTANATTFDGATTSVRKSTDLSTLTDTNIGLVSFWVKIAGGNGNTMYLIDNGSAHFFVNRKSDNTLTCQGFNSGGSRILDIEYTDATKFVAGMAWTHVLIGWNSGAGYMLVNGSAANVTVFSFPSVGNINFIGSGSWTTSCDGAASHVMNGCVAELWFDAQDQPSSINSSFESGGHPVSLGATGAIPTGKQPAVYLKDPFGTYGNNSGYGGNFNLIDVALSACGTAP